MSLRTNVPFIWWEESFDDHLFQDCPTVLDAQFEGHDPKWGNEQIQPDSEWVCAWCRHEFGKAS